MGGAGAPAPVEPLCGVDLVSLRRPVVGVDTCELHVLAEVVAAFPAQEAVLAGHPWFHGYSVAYRGQISYGRADLAVGEGN